jgi:hypothetical protein
MLLGTLTVSEAERVRGGKRKRSSDLNKSGQLTTNRQTN